MDAPMTMARLVVREAFSDEIPEIVELDARVAGVKRPDFWLDLSQQRCPKRTPIIVVATIGGTIVGYAAGDLIALTVRMPTCGWIYAIGVAAEFREHKVASALMELMTDHFRTGGATSIRTAVDVDDHLLMSFLCSFGMTAGPVIDLEIKLEEERLTARSATA